MKVLYINILYFSLPLNILVNSAQKNPSIIIHHTQTNRSLCECDLYMPNYDNDPQMKRVIQQFEDRTTQRFHEYDERMKEKRMQCKDKCDKEIQQIILKDKLEKELTEKFSTLQTDIQSDAIPTCICEKSMADKVEKGCLRCGYGLGTVAPNVGLLGGIGIHALNVLKPKAIADAIAVALQANNANITAAGLKAGNAAGVAEVVKLVESTFDVQNIAGQALELVFTTKNYTNSPTITQYIFTEFSNTCFTPESEHKLLCFYGSSSGASKVNPGLAYRPINAQVTSIVKQAEGAADVAAQAARESATNAIKAQETRVINTIFMSKQTAITASIIAIVVIVLIMMIIYWILRYRRKKKMKKKLQYIKLLEE
ncbi:rifin PIR protein,putative [Plasmodium sp. DRC-Itaito]|nr:rifin PIR protein,putative [Plasmodium sp. DRC-Itaito]